MDHFFRQFQCLDDVEIAGSHGFSLRRRDALWFGVSKSNFVPEENGNDGNLQQPDLGRIGMVSSPARPAAIPRRHTNPIQTGSRAGRQRSSAVSING
jgi:hypothetical protein